ncbi:MAG: sulfatase-like hydrolase/transferase [Cyanobacteria bacterium J06642_3]
MHSLNAEEEPENEDYPPEGIYPGFDIFRPRGVLHSYAAPTTKQALMPCETEIESPNGEDTYTVTDVTDFDEKIIDENTNEEVENPEFSYGQRVCDTGPLTKKRMETIDEEVLGRTEEFMLDAKQADEPFFTWFNTTRMHVFTHLKEDSQGETGLGIEADGMVEHDKMVGELVDFVDSEIDNSGDRDTIIIYTTDNGAEVFGWPDGGMTPFRSEKNTNWEGAFRVPAMIRWKGHIPAGVVSNEIMSQLDWVPTLMAAVGVDNIQGQLLKEGDDGKADTSYDEYDQYDVHLDGYNFLPYLISANKEEASSTSEKCLPTVDNPADSPKPAYCPPRHEYIYFTDDGYPSAARYDNWKLIFSEQREEGFNVWQEPYVDLRVPKLFNLRTDPFEKADEESGNYVDWRFRRIFLIGPIQLFMAKFLNTFVEYPPRQKPPSFNIGPIVDNVVGQIKRNKTVEDLQEKIEDLREEYSTINNLTKVLKNLQSLSSNN